MKLFLSVLSIVFSFSVLAGDITQNQGARSYGLGNTNLTSIDGFAIFHNPAALGLIENNSISTSSDLRYNIVGLNTFSALGTFKTSKFGNYGIAATRFGDDKYNETKFILSGGHKLEYIALGGSIHYFQSSIIESFTHRTIYFNLGGLITISEEFKVGMFISNVNQAQTTPGKDDQIPTRLATGASYTPNKKLLLAVQLEKETYQKANIKAGIEYYLAEFLILRSGINTNAVKGFFGVGIKYSDFMFDYAFTRHDVLGITHHFSLNYYFGNGNDEK